LAPSKIQLLVTFAKVIGLRSS